MTPETLDEKMMWNLLVVAPSRHHLVNLSIPENSGVFLPKRAKVEHESVQLLALTLIDVHLYQFTENMKDSICQTPPQIQNAGKYQDTNPDNLNK